ncbi:leucine dehydrogenase [Sphingobium sp. AP50]|uniref:Leu/Phe/Val dehydrogenase n=1 Tax=Sphingobium sp. AP50 TaxID=1884369 RepID=UPI0008C616E4|nr:Glu/Leu/Phe/Val dehydrogenase dimerization domain-containing protein [Sphingobium sp. AP50]SEJ72485.1 leucine dehydrogenase [Sphingobium sp. AP50]
MVIKVARTVPASQTIRLHDWETGLDGVIVIHSTALGPGAGGCRFWHYPDAEHAFADASRLAEGMSFKNAMAGLPFGGAKAVILQPAGSFERSALFRAFGRAVEALDGQYVTAEDVGTTVADMEEVSGVTRHVAGLSVATGRAGGDPSPWTALGVFESMQAAARVALGTDLKGLTVAVQGTGNVGANLCRRLADAGARLVIADVAPERRNRLEKILDALVVDVADIASVNCDIFAPCALGGSLTLDSVAAMKAKLVCGGANNQLATPEVAGALLDRGIAYVPDYVANAGGIISVSAEYLGEDQATVSERVALIGPRVAALLGEAAHTGLSPALVADRMAEEIMQAGVVKKHETIF